MIAVALALFPARGAADTDGVPFTSVVSPRIGPPGS
jgi:hypothetical protein